MKKPVIATNSGGIPELMRDGETGFLIQKDDYKGWIEKITLLLNDKKLAQRFGENGRKFVEEEFSWEEMAKNFVEIMKKYL
jgi:glycosyltransferase involved in cell wall biosynthesis